MGVAWSDNPDRVLVSGVWGGERAELRTVDLRTGNVEIFEPPVVFGENTLGDFAVSSDGSLVVYAEEIFSGDIWMIEALEGSF